MIWKATKEQVVDHLFGAGVYQWGWWADYGETDDGKLFAEVIDPDSDVDPYEEDPKTIRKEFTLSQLKKAVDELTKREDDYAKQIQRAIRDDDFDAGDADVVLQWLVFGEVVYA